MTKEQALTKFWESFGLTAYDENSVPSGENKPTYPYITYNVVTGSFGSDLALTASLWYKSSSWEAITTKADEISRAIGLGGVILTYDDGAIWIKRGDSFAQRMNDPNDSIRRIYLNIIAEYISAN